MIDLHLHTSRCGHAEGSPAELVAAAQKAGLVTIAFTDHLPLPEGYPGGYSMTWPELPLYVEEVHSAAEAASKDGGPEVLLGIEADYIRGNEMLVSGALMAHPFDVVLGSVHFLDGWAFDDPDLVDRYDEWDVDALWERYFEEVVAAAATGLFDVMAHPDLVKKFRFMPSGGPDPWYEEAASVFAQTGVAIEVNTAGLRKPCAEMYPSMAFLETCRRHGVPATLGSDAHRPREVGEGIDLAIAALVEAGYDSLVIFRGRKAEEVAL